MARTITYVKKNANKADRIITDTEEIDYNQAIADLDATIANLDTTKAEYLAQRAAIVATRNK